MHSQETLCLEIHINNLAILVNGPPQILLLAAKFDEVFINEESVAEAAALSLQPASVNGSEFYAEPPP